MSNFKPNIITLDASFHNYSNEMNIKKVATRQRRTLKCSFFFGNLCKLHSFGGLSRKNIWERISTKQQFRELNITGMENRIKSQIFSLPFVLNVFRFENLFLNSPSFPSSAFLFCFSLLIRHHFFSIYFRVLDGMDGFFFQNSFDTQTYIWTKKNPI